MKKTLQKLTYLFLLTLFLVPSLVTAQDGPLNCCQIGKQVIIGNATYTKDAFVGNGEVCHLGDVLPENSPQAVTPLLLTEGHALSGPGADGADQSPGPGGAVAARHEK